MKTFAALLVATAALAVPASAQDYPTRSVTIIAPFPAGASVDIIVRALGEHLTSKFGQTVLVENRPGAAGNIGAASVARANPDGYTLLMATTGQVSTNKFMYSGLTFDSEKDLEPIAVVGTAALLVTARPDAPFDTLKGLVDYAKANPDKINAGYPGNGTLGHITGELISQRQNVKFTAVQFQGSVQIIPAELGSQIDIGIDTLPPYVPVVQSGRIKALAIGSKQRNPNLPNVPTMTEAGFPGLDASVFYALLAPKGTPPAIIAKLNAASNEFLKSDVAAKIFEKVGIVVNLSTPAEAKAYIVSETEKWGPIIKSANIKF
jgi:tripartite-type tricarboxylate transporter receptor subunit TctC